MKTGEKVKNFLVFGSNGEIGQATLAKLEQIGNVYRGSRNLDQLDEDIAFCEGFDGIVWAQGLNATDSILDSDNQISQVLDANLIFTISSLQLLLTRDKIAQDSHLVIVGSIWSILARPSKLSYVISKAAVTGLVRSLAIDLGSKHIQVNAISPSPVDSTMTRKNLTEPQLARIVLETPIKRLVKLDELSAVIVSFANGNMSGITGQNIVVDGGWSVSKLA